MLRMMKLIACRTKEKKRLTIEGNEDYILSFQDH